MDHTGRRGAINRLGACLGKGTCTWCGNPVPKPRRTWCGQVCVDLYNLTQPDHLRSQALDRSRRVNPYTGRNECECALCYALEIDQAYVFGKAFEVDHIVPISEGGDPFGLENLRVLCPTCHKRETAALRRRLAEYNQANQVSA